MRALPNTRVLVYLFDADKPTRRDQAAALRARRQEDLDRPAQTAGPQAPPGPRRYPVHRAGHYSS